MKTLKQMLNEKGFKHFPDEIDDDVIKIVGEWLKQKRDEYTDNLTYPLGQRVLIGTFFIGLLEDLEK